MCDAVTNASEPTAEFTVPLKEVQSVEGQAVEMTCELSKPGQTVTWLKDAVELKADDRVELVVDGCDHRMVIRNATLEDEAEYTVKLTDDVTTKATLWVEGASKKKARNTCIAPQAAYRSCSGAVRVTDRADVQPIGHRLLTSHTQPWSAV